MQVAVTAATPQLVVDGEHVFFCGPTRTSTALSAGFSNVAEGATLA